MPTTITSAGITFNDATSLTSANIGTAQLVNGSVTAAKLGTNEQTRIAKAWVNFDGTTSPGTIRSSYNVSSITKNGTGDYTVNFATAMADANYSVVGMSRNNSFGAIDPNTGYGASICLSSQTAPTASSFRIWAVDLQQTGAASNVVIENDQPTINLVIFGN